VRVKVAAMVDHSRKHICTLRPCMWRGKEYFRMSIFKNMVIVRNFKILSDKFIVYSIHSCELNCSKKVKNSRNVSDGYRCVGKLSLCNRIASFEFWLGLFSVFIFCAVERGSPHLRMCRRYQGKSYWLHSLRFREFYLLWEFVCFYALVILSWGIPVVCVTYRYSVRKSKT
jgi:hypothetical protein